MYSLKYYKRLSKTNNNCLEHYMIYRDIYHKTKIWDTEISNKDIIELKDIILKCYEDNEDLRLSKITDFVADNYLNKNFTMEQLKECDKYYLGRAVEEDDIEKINIRYGMER